MKRLALLVAMTLALVGTAAAQPMMVDPSRMSGIPRPDPQVPAGTITVRLIRGALDQRMVGVEVALAGPDGKAQTVKTDGEGRATFSGLTAPGPYLASAKEGETALKSQPIELAAQMGSRVMLVFPKAAAPDGMGRPDKDLPPGTIVVRAEDAAGNGLEGLEVVLGHARAGEQQVVTLKAKTDVAGEAKFAGLDRKPTSGYLVEIVAHGARFAGKPFRLEENAGARVIMTIREVQSDLGTLTIAEGSHMLIEVTDDALQVIEVLRLHNAGTGAFDAGQGGLHIPLPREAVQLQAPDQNPSFSVDGHDAVYRGPLPPGDTQLRVAYVLPYKGESIELVQPTPIPFARLALVTQALPGLSVSGHDLVGEQREMQGRKLMVYFGGATPRGGELRVRVTGLPHADATPRYAAAGLAIALVVVFAIYAARGGGDRRTQLSRERQRLFDELVTVEGELDEAELGARKPLEQRRQKLVAELSEVYRGLDELGG